jgi:putative membrane protein
MLVNPAQILASLIYSAVGIIVFVFAFKLAERLLPFNLDKELAEDQNTAVGVLMGSVMVGLAIIIASAIHG